MNNIYFRFVWTLLHECIVWYYNIFPWNSLKFNCITLIVKIHVIGTNVDSPPYQTSIYLLSNRMQPSQNTNLNSSNILHPPWKINFIVSRKSRSWFIHILFSTHIIVYSFIKRIKTQSYYLSKLSAKFNFKLTTSILYYPIHQNVVKNNWTTFKCAHFYSCKTQTPKIIRINYNHPIKLINA